MKTHRPGPEPPAKLRAPSGVPAPVCRRGVPSARRLRTRLLSGIAAVAIAVPGLARAEAPPPPRPPEQTASAQPYGLHIVLADVAAVALLLSGQPALQAVATGSYVLSPPIVHLLHRRPARAAGSLGLRLLLPIAGGAIGTEAEGCGRDSDFLCGITGLVLGGLAGAVVASIVDAALLASAGLEARESSRPPLAKVGGVQLDYAGLTPQRNGGGLVLGGSF
jgi:hypothetical protein